MARTVTYGLLALLAGYGAYRGRAIAADAPALQIDRIIVRGNTQLSTGDLLDILDGLRGEHIVWADLEAWRQRLLASPWVQDAALWRSFPSTVEVTVSERKPMAIARVNDELYLVDDQGNAIDKYGPQYAAFDLPIVDGLLTFSGDASGEGERAWLAARVIAALEQEPEVGSLLSQIDVSDPRNATVILRDDPAVIYVGRERFLPRLRSYLQLAPTLRERVSDIDYIDLRFDDRIFVGPTGNRVKSATALARGVRNTGAGGRQ